jgi:hypothetical protein
VKTGLIAWLNRSMPVQRLPKGSAALSLEGCSASALGSGLGSGFGNAIRSRISLWQARAGIGSQPIYD